MNKVLRFVRMCVAAGTLFIFNFSLASADLNTTLGITNPGGLPDKSATDIIGKIVLWLLGMVAVIALAVLVYGGLMYILSLGDEKKAEKAKHVILYAIIGVIITGASFAIIATVQNILKP